MKNKSLVERQRAQAARARAIKAQKQAEWKKSQGKLSDDGGNNKGDKGPELSEKLTGEVIKKEETFNSKLELIKQGLGRLDEERDKLIPQYNSLIDNQEAIEAELTELARIGADILEDDGDSSELIQESRKKYQELKRSLLETKVAAEDLDDKINRLEDKIAKLKDGKAALLKSAISKAKAELESKVYWTALQGERLAQDINVAIKNFDETVEAYRQESGGGFEMFWTYRNLIWNGLEQNPFKKLGSIKIKWQGPFAY